MKHLKHWKYQCLMSAPFLPWVYIHWADWIYGTMLAVGWIPGRLDGMAAFTAVLMVVSTIVFIVGYCRVHDKW